MKQQQDTIEFNTPYNGTVKAQLCNQQMLQVIKDIDTLKLNNIRVTKDVDKLTNIQKQLEQIRLRNIK